jgi:hypothetical protein
LRRRGGQVPPLPHPRYTHDARHFNFSPPKVLLNDNILSWCRLKKLNLKNKNKNHFKLQLLLYCILYFINIKELSILTKFNVRVSFQVIFIF